MISSGVKAWVALSVVGFLVFGGISAWASDREPGGDRESGGRVRRQVHRTLSIGTGILTIICFPGLVVALGIVLLGSIGHG